MISVDINITTLFVRKVFAETLNVKRDIQEPVDMEKIVSLIPIMHVFISMIKTTNQIIKKNYETYNNERKEQVFASSSKFQIKRFR